MSQPFDNLFRFIIIGDQAVGKSCLSIQFTDHKFRHRHELTIGVEYGSKTIEIKGKTIKIQIWDTAGQEKFHSIISSYYKGAAGALLVYDITSHESFEHIESWLKELKEKGSNNICCILVGNKKDLEEDRKVMKEEGEKLAKEKGLLFLETSARNDENVQEAFILTVEKILEQIEATGVDHTKPNQNIQINIDNNEDEEGTKKDKKKCCSNS